MEDINKLIDELKAKTNKAIEESYDKGFIDGVLKCHALDGIRTPLDSTEYKIIKEFAGWCYIHGIDFSYMSKGNEPKPFVERVLEEYEKDRTKSD